MAFTSHQKHYIKKHYKQLSAQEIADSLGLPIEEVERYINQHFKHFAANSSSQLSSGFDLITFLIENRFFLFGLIGLILFVYASSLGHGFVSDDIATLARNPRIGDISLVFESIGGFMRNLLLYIVYQFFGLHEWAFRSLNLLFHIGTAVLVFVISYLISHKKPLSILVALLFAVHPILVESIVWISGGPYVQGAFFLLLALLFYLLRDQNKKYYYFSLLSFALAIFSSEKAITFPLVLLLYEFSLCSLKNTWKKLIPYFGINLVIVVFLLANIGERIVSVGYSFDQPTNAVNPLLQVPIAIFSYLKLLFYPRDLSLYQTELGFSVPQLVAIVAVFLLYLTLIIYCYKKKSASFFLAVFYARYAPANTASYWRFLDLC